MNEFHTHVLESQGKEEYDNYIYDVKYEFFGPENVKTPNDEDLQKLPKYIQLRNTTPLWEEAVQLDLFDKKNGRVQKCIISE